MSSDPGRISPEQKPSAPPDEDAAPGGLALVRAFVNTYDVDDAEEGLDGPGALAAWLERQGIPAGDRLTDEDLRAAISLREALRKLLLANNGMPLDRSAVERVQAAAREAPLHVEVGADASAALAPGGEGVKGLSARLLTTVLAAQAEGTWERLKACPAHDCEWAFYDQSRNRSRTWCSMEVCGNRSKTRSYRARRAQGERR